MENSEDTKEPTQVIALGIKDHSLMHLALCANWGLDSAVTIMIGGQVVAGILVSGQEYAEHTAKEFRDANSSEEVGNALANFYDELANDYRKEDGHEMPLNFIHIKDPAYLTGDGNWYTIRNSYLRVAIDKVAAFSNGKPDTDN